MTSKELATLPYRPNAGLMLVNAAGLVFAAQRLDYPGEAWQMPQGGIDKGEEPRPAALRELEEETGIAPDLVTIEAETDGWISYDFPEELAKQLWRGGYRGQKQKWFLMRFHGTDDQINIQTEHPEFSRWKWMAPDQVIAKIVPFKKHIYEQVFDQFKGLL